jgi:hypothetical protein
VQRQHPQACTLPRRQGQKDDDRDKGRDRDKGHKRSKASFNVSPDVVTAGDKVWAEGTGCKKFAPVTIWFDGDVATQDVGAERLHGRPLVGQDEGDCGCPAPLGDRVDGLQRRAAAAGDQLGVLVDDDDQGRGGQRGCQLAQASAG